MPARYFSMNHRAARRVGRRSRRAAAPGRRVRDLGGHVVLGRRSRNSNTACSRCARDRCWGRDRAATARRARRSPPAGEVEPEGGERARILRPVGTRLDILRRHAHAGQERADLLRRACGGDFVAGSGRQIDQDSAGGLAAPGPREADDVGALVERQLSAPVADEQLDRVDALPDGDRVALAQVAWNFGGSRPSVMQPASIAAQPTIASSRVAPIRMGSCG